MKFTERLPRVYPLIGFLLIVATGLVLYVYQTWNPLELLVLDRQFTLLRLHPQPVQNDVLVVGIDEAAFKAFPEPFALWHTHLGKFFQAMALARPSALGLDIVLPEHSYQFLVPGYDQALLEGILALRGKVPLALSQSLDDQGQLRMIFPPFVSIAGRDALATPLVCMDRDGVPRRLDGKECANQTRGMLSLSESMSAKLGITHAWHGMIDYSLGSAFQYIPFAQVLDLFAKGNSAELVRLFQNKPVVLGVILPFTDRLPLPVPLAAWEPENRRLPGVLIHAQSLRAMLNRGPIRLLPQSLLLLFTLLPALFWWGRSTWTKLLLLAFFIAGFIALSTLRLWQGQYLPPVGSIIVACLGFVGRTGFDSLRQYREKKFLTQAFGGHVSPVILKEILAGKAGKVAGGRQRVCVLYAEIQGFSERLEQSELESIIELLNGYFDLMSVVIHKHGGVVDKFIGAGLIAFFGAPQAMAQTERKALEAAQEMLLRLHEYNASLKLRSLEPIVIGIGIHSGEVFLGYIGSEARHQYTAIGDTVNAVAGLESVCGEMGYPIVFSTAVLEGVDGAAEPVDLGLHRVPGNPALHLHGWRPAILDRLS